MPFRVLLSVTAFLAFFWLPVAVGYTAPPQKTLGPGVILLQEKAPASLEQPPVPFDHDRHTQVLGVSADSCAKCHNRMETKQGPAFSPEFAGISPAAQKQEKRYHDGCASCHEMRAKAGEAHGPAAADCRSCHTGATSQPQLLAFAFDASLHDIHLASTSFSANPDSKLQSGAANCAACHHAVELREGTKVSQQQPCSFCHMTPDPARQPYAMPQADNFPQAAHAKCISCHIGLSGSQAAASAMTGAPTPDFPLKTDEVSATGVLGAASSTGPATCAGCHSAAALEKLKSGHYDAHFLVGQPVTRLIMPPSGDRSAEAEGIGQPLQAVTFNHGLHERSVTSCTSCHHMAFATCASCHKQDGLGDVVSVREASLLKAAGLEKKPEPFGGALALPAPTPEAMVAHNGRVTFYQAMHAKNADGSCASCHGEGKLERAQCAGCHTSKTAAVEKDCTFCHRTPMKLAGVQTPAMTPAVTESLSQLPAVSAESGMAQVISRAAPQDMPVYGMPPQTDSATSADPQPALLMRDFPAPAGTLMKPVVKPDVAIPEVVIIGSLTNEYEPSVFPHGDIYRALMAGINRAAPSLNGLHARDLTACSACHHHSPAGFVPPKCSTCHDAAPGGLNSRDGRPLLKAAYHLQCMGCHERMDIVKPADTNCASGCHQVKVAQTR